VDLREVPSIIRARCRYTWPGLVVAVIFAAASFTPSLLPRPATYQGLIAGISGALGYGLGLVGAWVWREYADRGPEAPSAKAWRWLAAAGGVVLLLAIVLGVHWQRQTAGLIGERPESRWAAVLIPIIGVLVFVALLAVARTLRTAYGKVVVVLDRKMGHRAARATGLLLLIVVIFLLTTGLAWRWFIDGMDGSLAIADRGTPDGIERPTTGLRSGGPGSLVRWDSLGEQGRIFTGSGPDAAQIEKFTERPAKEPIRIFAGTSSESEPEKRAQLAVKDLERAGGFDRASLLVVTTTGRGWVEPSSAGSFEYLTGGDSAIVAMQYSHLPSALSYLADQNAARIAGRDLFDAVYERWSQLPSDHRPRLYVFGESLGSFGAETAFSGEFDLRNRTSGALFVGPPSFNPLYREFVDGRDRGSPEIEPVYRKGRVIRFSNQPRTGIPPADQPWTSSRVVYLQHPSDPITWWSPSLLWSRPDWLTETRGSDVSPSMRWIPLVSFWQVTGDLALGFSQPPGHGHNYSGEHVYAWDAILQPSGWTPEMLDRLAEQLRRP
jgi:uncharacterized membrane protein